MLRPGDIVYAASYATLYREPEVVDAVRDAILERERFVAGYLCTGDPVLILTVLSSTALVVGKTYGWIAISDLTLTMAERLKHLMQTKWANQPFERIVHAPVNVDPFLQIVKWRR